MLKKVFIQTQFGTPHAWTQQYVENFRRLESTGWGLRIFTPNDVPGAGGNVEVVPMDLAEFDRLIHEKCGIDPKNYIAGHAPRKVVSDYYPAYGHILEDHIRDVDFWGITNWDCVYGRLSKFLPDAELDRWDIWADEGCVAFNGIFTLMRNRPEVNFFYQHVPNWEVSFASHDATAFDEHQFTRAMRANEGLLLMGHPDHFGLHSYDRLVQHRPAPNLYFETDGALIERYDDRTHFPARVGWHGREIMLFHFSMTKRWPVSQ